MKISAVLILLSGFCFGVFALMQEDIQLVAPDVLFTTLKGEKIQLSHLQGQPVLVTFWATDCANCIKEIPDLIELYNQFHPQGLEIIAVAMYYDPPSHVVEMTRAKKIPYKVALDLKAHHARAFGEVELIPSLFLISPEGEIVMHKTGLFDQEVVRQKIQYLLKG